MSLILHSRAFPLLATRTFDRGFERLVNNLVDNAPVAPRRALSAMMAALLLFSTLMICLSHAMPGVLTPVHREGLIKTGRNRPDRRV